MLNTLKHKGIWFIILGLIMVFSLLGVNRLPVYAEDETSYTITFVYNDLENTIETLTLPAGSTLTYDQLPKPSDISFNGGTFCFQGWYKDGTNVVVGDSFVVTEDMRFTGFWAAEYTISIPAKVDIDSNSGIGQFEVEANLGVGTIIEVYVRILNIDGTYNNDFDYYGTGNMKCGERKLPFKISDTFFEAVTMMPEESGDWSEKKTISKKFYVTVDDDKLDNYAGEYTATLNFEILASLNDFDYTSLYFYHLDGIEDQWLKYVKAQYPNDKEIQSYVSLPVEQKKE